MKRFPLQLWHWAPFCWLHEVNPSIGKINLISATKVIGFPGKSKVRMNAYIDL